MNNVKKSKRIILPLFITVATLFMGVGYAVVNNTILDIFGMAEASVLEEIYISDIDNLDNIIINFYEGTLLNSKVVLDDTNIESTKTLEITLHNNTNSNQYFEEVKYQLGNMTYDNTNIEFLIDENLQREYELKPKESVTFTITFKYTEEYKNYIKDNPEELLDNELNSILNFYFGYLIKFNKGKGNIKPDNYYLGSGSLLHEINTEVPTREGYIFTGWYDKEDYLEGQMFYDESQQPQSINSLIYSNYSTTLYPGWRPIHYTVTFHEKETLLPSEYQEVAYIESTGKEYLDTLYYPTSNTVIEAKLYTESTANKNWFGSSNSNTSSYILNSMSSSSIEIKFSNTSWNVINVQNVVRVPFTVSYGKIIKVNDITIKDNSNVPSFEDTSPLWIFSRYNGSAGSRIAGRIYYFKIYENGELQKNYVPCYRKIDKKSGLYDTINNEFIIDKNGGNFKYAENNYIQEFTYDEPKQLLRYQYDSLENSLVGWSLTVNDPNYLYLSNDEVINLTSIDGDNIDLYAQYRKKLTINYHYNLTLDNGYTLKTYIESPGGIYIDTNYYPTKNTTIETKVFNGNVGNRNWFGASATQGNAFAFNSYSINQLEYSYGNTGWKTITTPFDVVNNEYTISYGQKIIVNNNLYVDNTSMTDFISTSSLLLFARNGGSVANQIAGKMYYFKIYENDTLVKELIPCTNNISVGMCDILDNQFYPGIGTKSFVTGSLTQSINYNINEKLNPNLYEVSGYRFIGWNTKSDGTGDNYFDTDDIIISSRYEFDELNLYAMWEKVN